MEIGRTIIKTLIVVLEGCVVKLKEFEAYLDEKVEKKYVTVESLDTSNGMKNSTKGKNFSTENFYNLSYLDQYVQSIGLPVGSNFLKIIQRTELKTEYNLIETIVNSLSSDIDQFGALYNNIKELKFVVFQYIQPSPLRKEETRVVDKKTVCDMLSEDGLMYDNEKSLYENSLRVIESKQKLIMNAFVKRFDSTIEKYYSCSDVVSKDKIMNVLIKELNDRKQIVEMKLRR